MSITRLYLIRHAEAEGNLYRRAHGWYDSLITDRGYRQIAALAGRFAGIPIDAVYSSDRFRTRTTARAVLETHPLTLTTSASLREINLGAWEDRPWGELAERDSARLCLFNSTSPAFQAPGGESYGGARERIAAEIFRIAAAHPGQTVSIFSHGTVLRQFLGAAKGLAPEELHTLGHADNTAVSCIEVENGTARILFENDNSHLPEEISTLAHQNWWKCKEGSVADPNLHYAPLDMERDSEIYLAARREAWLSIHGSIAHFDGDGFTREALERCRQDPWAVTAAYLREEPVGLIQVDTARFAQENVGYIPFYYMNPVYRKQGLGVQLLGQAVSICRPLGRDKLRLRCAPDNAVAQRFYRRYGFRKIGEAQGTRVPLDLLEKYIGYGKE